MKVAHEDEITKLRASLGQASSEEIERMKAKHAEEIKQLGIKNDKKIAQINTEHD